MEKSFIYILIDPRNQQVRYVGKSDNGEERYPKSWKLSKKEGRHKRYWVESLLKLGLEPLLEVIDEVNIFEWEFWERHYISLYKSWGFDLTNLTIGGDGISKGHKMPPRSSEHMERIKASKIKNGTWRKSHSLETKKKITNSRLGILPSEETKLKRKTTILSWSLEKQQDYNKRRTLKATEVLRSVNNKRKGKTLEEIYGYDKAQEIKAKSKLKRLYTRSAFITK